LPGSRRSPARAAFAATESPHKSAYDITWSPFAQSQQRSLWNNHRSAELAARRHRSEGRNGKQEEGTPPTPRAKPHSCRQNPASQRARVPTGAAGQHAGGDWGASTVSPMATAGPRQNPAERVQLLAQGSGPGHPEHTCQPGQSPGSLARLPNRPVLPRPLRAPSPSRQGKHSGPAEAPARCSSTARTRRAGVSVLASRPLVEHRSGDIAVVVEAAALPVARVVGVSRELDLRHPLHPLVAPLGLGDHLEGVAAFRG